MATDGYDTGFSHGYADYERGGDCRFFSTHQKRGQAPRVFERRNGFASLAIVEPLSRGYARGYIDGFMRAESDSHD